MSTVDKIKEIEAEVNSRAILIINNTIFLDGSYAKE